LEAIKVDRLSAREEKILELLLVGASNKRIARDLNISTATVKADMHEILRKLNARNRTQAAHWGLENRFGQADRPSLSADRYSAGGTILVVDDDEPLAYATATFLTRSGYDVVAANGTTSALEILNSGRHIDLVLADIVMPSGQPNGIAFGRIARMKQRHIKLAFMTGYRDLGIDASELMGKLFYKPLDFEFLRTEIAAVLAA
jgi:DNA-binding NarL/FixJ family response regulator